MEEKSYFLLEFPIHCSFSLSHIVFNIVNFILGKNFMHSLSLLPIPVKKALRTLGLDIRKARLRRRITMELMAQRASISRTTLTKVEKRRCYGVFGNLCLSYLCFRIGI